MMSDDYIDDDYIVNLPGASSFHFGRHVLRLFFLLSFLFSLLGNAVSPPVDFFGGSLRALQKACHAKSSPQSAYATSPEPMSCHCITIYIVNVPGASGFHCTFSGSERHS